MVRITDDAVLEALEKNGRIPAAHIATKLGVTETAIRKRIAKLEEKGIIQKYTIHISPKKSAYTVVFIGIDTKPESYMKILDKVAKDEVVKKAYTTSGDHQIQLECWFLDQESFRNYVRNLEENPDIVKVCPGIVQEQVK